MQIKIKEQYDTEMQGLHAFLLSGTTWRDLSKEEFSDKSKHIKSLLVLSEIALQEGIYSKEHLKEDLQLINKAIKQLIF
ncbi:hypothetical protein ABEP17_19595 [Priestia flexa]|uniref:hypothetical protein n=1 Tax=Priestia flexa TaxID=86664 RepID=UPI002490F6FA|nr:hypothetical protein [Priestia flexa]